MSYIDAKTRTLRELLDNKKYSIEYYQREYKWGSEKTLETLNISKMPDYIFNNLDKYSNWLET